MIYSAHSQGAAPRLHFGALALPQALAEAHDAVLLGLAPRALVREGAYGPVRALVVSRAWVRSCVARTRDRGLPEYLRFGPRDPRDQAELESWTGQRHIWLPLPPTPREEEVMTTINPCPGRPISGLAHPPSEPGPVAGVGAVPPPALAPAASYHPPPPPEPSTCDTCNGCDGCDGYIEGVGPPGRLGQEVDDG